MKNAIRYAFLASFALAGVHCGGAPNDSKSNEAELAEPPPGQVRMTVVKQESDGTVTRTSRFVTAEEVETIKQARLERARMKREGVEMQSIGPAQSCFVSLILYDQPHQGGNFCCIEGEGNAYLNTLCSSSMGWTKTLWAGESGGLYGSTYPYTNCGYSFDSWDLLDPPDCNNIMWVQLDF